LICGIVSASNSFSSLRVADFEMSIAGQILLLACSATEAFNPRRNRAKFVVNRQGIAPL
jgi:hypothetical protein